MEMISHKTWCLYFDNKVDLCIKTCGSNILKCKPSRLKISNDIKQNVKFEMWDMPELNIIFLKLRLENMKPMFPCDIMVLTRVI